MKHFSWEALRELSRSSLWVGGSEDTKSVRSETNYTRPRPTWPLRWKRRSTSFRRIGLLLTLCLWTTLVSACCTSSAVPGRPPERTKEIERRIRKWKLDDSFWIVPVKDMDMILLDRRQWKAWAEAQSMVSRGS